MRLSHPDFRLFQLVTFPASGDGAVFVLNQGDGINQRQTDFQPCHFIFIIHFDVNGWRIRCQALAQVAASAEQVLVTAAVAEDIPEAWDARRIEVTMEDGDTGRVSVVRS